MPTPKRRPDPPVTNLLSELSADPHHFNFFQAVHLIDTWLRRDGARHGKTLAGVLRFKNSVSLAFSASQVEALTFDAAPSVPGPLALAVPADPGSLRHIRMTPAFMGYLGVNGVLPHDYTATIAAQIRFDKHEGGRAFFDTFSHRTMMLFYRAWANSRIECRDDGDDGNGGGGFFGIQLALAGRSRRAAPVAERLPVCTADAAVLPEEVAVRYAALIRHRPMPGEMIAAALADYFGVRFRFQGFVGAWVTVKPENRSVLGVRNKVLGYDTMLGTRFWRCDAIARLWVGPLARADFDRFLAGGSAGKALKAMLALFAVPTVTFEVRLVLRAAEIEPAKLDMRSRLGHGAFLVTAPRMVDDHQTRYHIAF